MPIFFSREYGCSTVLGFFRGGRGAVACAVCFVSGSVHAVELVFAPGSGFGHTLAVEVFVGVLSSLPKEKSNIL